MADQKGLLPVQGTVGNITFYKKPGGGYGIKSKSAISGKRIATDPAFQRTRENGAEFGTAGKAGKTLRMAFASLSQYASDSKLVSRLTREMMKVVHSDTVSIRGMRNVADGNAELLTGFEFNMNGVLSVTFTAPYTASIDRAAGELKLEIPSFVPMSQLKVPVGCTHYVIHSAGAEVDFVNRKNVTDIQSTAALSWNNEAAPAVTLNCKVTAGSTVPLFLALGIEFFETLNGSLYPLKNGAFNTLSLVKISGA